MKFMSSLFVLLCIVVSAALAHTITQAEYYFDADPGAGSGYPLAIAEGGTAVFADNISVSGLSPGPHTLFVRMKREDGVWSVPQPHTFTNGAGSEQIGQAEYFFDTDPGAGNGHQLAITAGESIAIADSFPVNGLVPGLHSLKVRVKNLGGVWSQPQIHSFGNTAGNGQIAQAEYYFDQDPGQGNGNAIPLSSNGTVCDTTIELPSIGLGAHTLYVRNLSSMAWAAPVSQMIRVRNPLHADSNLFAEAEIFFGADPGQGNGCPLTTDDAHRFVSASDFSLGEHIVYGRARDASGEWTAVDQDTFNVIEPHLLVAAEVDTIDTQARVFWSKYPAATEYHLHYDSVSTGDFTQYYTIAAPDTSILMETASRIFFYVLALQPEADEPCQAVALTARSKKENSQLAQP